MKQKKSPVATAATSAPMPAAAMPKAMMPVDITPSWFKFPSTPIAITLLFLAFLFIPRVQENERVVWAFAGTAGVLFTWTLVLWATVKKSNFSFPIEFAPPLKSHYIQGSVQFLVYCYWGYYWREVYTEAPLIVGQLVFLYCFDALLSWSRGRAWRLGFGPLPIILSCNIFMWFKDDWYAFQFLLIATCALGKEFVKWTREGRRTHIFNPSAFGLALFSVVLIFTNTTDNTLVGRIADKFASPPHIYLVVFSLGLVVQYFFSVTLMTVAAASTLILMGLIYFWATGTYYFVFTNIPAPVFLGFHLLVTDPSTSPRGNVGRVIFGAFYGVLTFLFFGFLTSYGSLTVYDKLLPIPILNLSVQWIDRISKTGFLGKISSWEMKFDRKKWNMAHIAIWVGLFGWMLTTGFVEGPQEGSNDQFWRKALAEGKTGAGKGLIEVLKWQSRQGFAPAWNELGGMYLDGKLLTKDPLLAARCFSQASKLGSVAGSANLVTQFMSQPNPKAVKSVTMAFEHLEQECNKGDGKNDGVGGAIFHLLGTAYEQGKGRPMDKKRAVEYYKNGCALGDKPSCEALTKMPNLK